MYTKHKIQRYGSGYVLRDQHGKTLKIGPDCRFIAKTRREATAELNRRAGKDMGKSKWSGY